MSFDINGFLGESVDEVVKSNYEKQIDIFRICEEINTYAQNVKYDFKINNYDMQGLLAITMFSKILNTFQAVIILYKYGLSSQAKMLTRIELESLFILKCIIDDEENIDILIKSKNKRREILLKNIIRNPEGVYNPFLNEDLKKELEDLTVKNKKEKAKLFSPRKWAEKSGSYIEYYYAYETLCKDVHIDIRNLEQYALFDGEGNVREFNLKSNTNDIKEVLLHTASNGMVQAIMYMSKYCNIDNDLVIQDFINGIIDL